MAASRSPPRSSPNNPALTKQVHWLQNHWYRLTPLHTILYPVSLVFRAVVSLRRALYQNASLPSERLLVPVVVIGNISVGGTGKTPLTLALAQQLVEKGSFPVIVSRGYKGSARQPQQVFPDSKADAVGDEPLLMAIRNICPVWVGKDRVAAARAAIHSYPRCDIVLCDDGLQHYRLQRDFEIAVVDGTLGYGNGLLLPAGPLREPPSRLLEMDAIVVNGGTAHEGKFAMQLTGEVFHNLVEPEITATASELQSDGIHAVAGIGNPQRFFSHLESLGIRFTPHAFPDHHAYHAGELSFGDCSAILLTEKDAVKCISFADARYWVLRVEARIDPALSELILRKIKSHGSQTA